MNYNAKTFAQKRSFLLEAVIACAVVVAGIAVFAEARPARAADMNPFVGQMQLGTQSPEVTKLQIFLAAEPAIYPAGLVTGYYGPLTAEAVRQFQVSYELPQVGRVGPLTLAAMNSIVTSGRVLDVSAPRIFTIEARTTGTTSVITWNTSETARGVVYYSTQPIITNEVSRSFAQPYVSGTQAATSGMGSTQAVTLQGLAPRTTYYYLIEAIDASGNTSVTQPSVFVTGT